MVNTWYDILRCSEATCTSVCETTARPTVIVVLSCVLLAMILFDEFSVNIVSVLCLLSRLS